MTQHAASDGDDPTRRVEQMSKLTMKLELEVEPTNQTTSQVQGGERKRELI